MNLNGRVTTYFTYKLSLWMRCGRNLVINWLTRCYCR
ncbi:unnamed protein product [Callosobruchus maculatus]|uniref:Uncharacterized protein n=1 Tax=Callosobruchus maculatus TaxID=64391 RepID=A0A653DI11_CALMS|nr:unnamed protein product [Callosobruchus maculatus]